MKGNGWLWKKDAGNGYDAFVLQCVRLDDFPVSGASRIRRTPKTDDTKPAHKAINELMLDCFKKVRESRNKRKRAAAQEELRAEAGNIAKYEEADAGGRQAKRPRYEDRRPLVIYVLDPADATHHDPQLNERHWDLPGIKKLAVIYDSLINDLYVKVSAHFPV